MEDIEEKILNRIVFILSKISTNTISMDEIWIILDKEFPEYGFLDDN